MQILHQPVAFLRPRYSSALAFLAAGRLLQWQRAHADSHSSHDTCILVFFLPLVNITSCQHVIFIYYSSFSWLPIKRQHFCYSSHCITLIQFPTDDPYPPSCALSADWLLNTLIKLTWEYPECQKYSVCIFFFLFFPVCVMYSKFVALVYLFGLYLDYSDEGGWKSAHFKTKNNNYFCAYISVVKYISTVVFQW